MLTINNNSRRSFLQIGSLGIGGLTLPNLLRQQAQAADAGQPVKKKSVILVWLAGGPSHLNMYDLKPNAPAEIRGEFRPIPTNVSGIEISEHLPRQAAMMDKLAIVRSAFHTNGGHGMGSQWMIKPSKRSTSRVKKHRCVTVTDAMIWDKAAYWHVVW